MTRIEYAHGLSKGSVLLLGTLETRSFLQISCAVYEFIHISQSG